MSVRDIEDIYPLAPMQQGMLFHSLYAPESGVYFEQTSWTLRGDLDVSAFERAWQRVVDRHPILRTAFVWEDLDEALQVLYRGVELPLEQRDWRGLTQAEQQQQREAFLLADREQGFELSEAPLMRLALLRTAEEVYDFVWSHHHLLLDGWSQPVLFQEVLALYQAFRAGQDISLPASRPYRDYIAWLQQQDMERAQAFWRRTLQGFVAPTPLAVDATPAPGDLGAAEQDYVIQRGLLPSKLTTALQELTRQYGLTLNTVMQGAWALLLSRYSGETDVVFGATVSGRPADLPGAESMVGLFINTLPMRVPVWPEAPVLSWLQELQTRQAELRQYEYSPLVEIQGWSKVPRGLPLFESLLVFENYPVDDAVRDATQEMVLAIDRGRSFTRTNYPLTLAISPGREIGLEIAYDCRRFDAPTITRLLGHYRTLLEGIVADPQRHVSTLPLLTQAEQGQLLVEWNTTQAEYPADRCVHEWFEAQVEQTPNALALVFQDRRLTYRELNQRANQLAHYVQKQGVGPETLVGLCVERSPEMVVGLLGVLKAGAAYLPLDPDSPPERLAFILKDAQVPLLLTQEHLLERLPPFEAQVLRLDSDWPAIAQESDNRQGAESGVCDLHLGLDRPAQGYTVAASRVVQFCERLYARPGNRTGQPGAAVRLDWF
jgi:surfactin family lipopeptide synthetase C